MDPVAYLTIFVVLFAAAQSFLMYWNERPWVTFQLLDIDGLDEVNAFRANRFNVLATGPLERFFQLVPRYKIMNTGRTVARIVDFTVVFGHPKALPPRPDYNPPTGQNDTARQALCLLAPQAALEEAPFRHQFDKATMWEIINGERELVIYGYVRYRDVLRIPHTSRFCMVGRFPIEDVPARIRFHFGGPRPYNQYT